MSGESVPDEDFKAILKHLQHPKQDKFTFVLVPDTAWMVRVAAPLARLTDEEVVRVVHICDIAKVAAGIKEGDPARIGQNTSYATDGECDRCHEKVPSIVARAVEVNTV